MGGSEDGPDEIQAIGMRGELRTWQGEAARSGGLFPGAARVPLHCSIIMCLSSCANTMIALCLGWLVDAVNPEVAPRPDA